MSESGLQAVEPPQPTKEDLFAAYEKLITIEVLGKQVEVPENNPVLRCFQYLSMKTISYGEFCWNGDCTNCQVWYHQKGQSEAEDKPALSCRLDVTPGMVITRLNQFIVLEEINKQDGHKQSETRGEGQKSEEMLGALDSGSALTSDF